MRWTAVALALAFGVTRAHAQDQLQLQIDQSVILQAEQNARWQAEEMRLMMEDSPTRWAEPHNDVIPAATPPADLTAIPTFWPKPARFRDSVSVTLTSHTPFATIYYTTDGTIPTVRSAQYKAPITVAKTARVLAIAIAPDHWQSPTAIGAYEIH